MADKIVVPEMMIKNISVTLAGDTPLITHKFSEKALKMIEDKQQKKATKGKNVRNPQEEFEGGIYKNEAGKPCFPANAFKSSAVRAATDLGLKMTDIRRAFLVIGEFVDIISDEPIMRTDRVVIGMGTTDIRYRPQFNNWKVQLSIKYNSMVLSLAQLLNLFNVAGFGVGIGEMRTEKKGGYNFGSFHVESYEELD